MQITIYKNFSKEVNSTKQPSGGTAVSCTLKEDTSLLHPVFILQGADFEVNYVSWGSRYYFVDDIVSIRNGAVELHCSVDPLASFKSAIGSSTQYVVRSASNWSARVVDKFYPCTSDVDVSRVSLDNLHTGFVNGGTYVLGTLGGGSASVDGVKYYILTPSDFASLMNYLGDPTQNDMIDYNIIQEISASLQKEIVNPFQYFTSCMWFPFTISSAQVSQPVTFGWWEATGFVCDYIDPSDPNASYAFYQADFTIPLHPDAGGVAQSYLNSAPYTKLLLHCYGFGDIPLDATLFNDSANHKGKVKIYVDYYSGVGLLLVENDTGICVYRGYAQIGVPVQLSQVTQHLLQAAVGVVSSFAAAGQGNFIGMLSGVGDAMEGMLPQVEKAGAYGTRTQFTEIPSVTVIHNRVTPSDVVRHGKPLMQAVSIGSLSGFIICDHVDLDITGTPEEKDYIVRYMESGFYYE